ncbi:MAG: DUF4290 domain-containing protein [Bacteroidetes bacterium]|nr:DUF4290 domain-containing protein [Bacteroidota bacterium]MBP6414322.1 DUF4290 domain-containing protein [Bacteroidia bacterium]MBK9798205.1 DUF4290 domain-containing protein [Bacteroidota bacterium]HRH03115.1 DUF4290 domain-containing protein [Bacteroidia bacterium]HRH08341.1 DUF4290 domain-containing protein [Bacteroidia bacterium]
MDYNTELPHLVISEYGRNIQKMVDHALSIADREERNRVARAIIDVMGQLNPHLRDVNDFKHKLWDHLFIISKFQLDVDSPYPKPSRETFETKPEMLSYPSNHIRYKHYGKSIEKMIAKAKDMEDGDMRNAFVEAIANQMKRSYVNWNKDSVSDDVITEQLGLLSKGELKLRENFRLQAGEFIAPRPQNQQNNNNKKRKFQNKQKNRNNGGGDKKKF